MACRVKPFTLVIADVRKSVCNMHSIKVKYILGEATVTVKLLLSGRLQPYSLWLKCLKSNLRTKLQPSVINYSIIFFTLYDHD
jgi:hypothetical protein